MLPYVASPPRAAGNLQTVSLEGSGTDETVTKSCYSTQLMTCATSEMGLTLVRQIPIFSARTKPSWRNIVRDVTDAVDSPSADGVDDGDCWTARGTKSGRGLGCDMTPAA